MKIIIFTVSAGGGHNSMTRSIENCIGDRAEVKVYDLFKAKDKKRSKISNDFYFFMSRKMIWLSNAFYRWILHRNVNRKKRTLFHFMTRKAKPQVLDIMKEYKPDVVFCAHTYAAHIMSEFREKGLIGDEVKIFSVVSDYEVSSYTELTTNIDYLVAPGHNVDKEMFRRGFKPEQILYLGIPVQTKFSEFIDKKEARKMLDIDQDKPTIMIMNGEVGFGNPVSIIENLSEIDIDFQVLVVCGRNESLKAELDEKVKNGKFKKSVYPFGFIGNVDVLMSASDLLIGKIGGVAIAEAFNKRILLVASNKLPWQEYDNMVYLCGEGACDYIDKPKNARKIVEPLLRDEELRATRLANIDRIRKPNATRDIVDAMLNSVK